MAIGTTKIMAANRTDSLRTTIPVFVARAFNLTRGDMVDWDLVPDGTKFGVSISFRKS